MSSKFPDWWDPLQIGQGVILLGPAEWCSVRFVSYKPIYKNDSWHWVYPPAGIEVEEGGLIKNVSCESRHYTSYRQKDRRGFLLGVSYNTPFGWAYIVESAEKRGSLYYATDRFGLHFLSIAETLVLAASLPQRKR